MMLDIPRVGPVVETIGWTVARLLPKPIAYFVFVQVAANATRRTALRTTHVPDIAFGDLLREVHDEAFPKGGAK